MTIFPPSNSILSRAFCCNLSVPANEFISFFIPSKSRRPKDVLPVTARLFNVVFPSTAKSPEIVELDDERGFVKP